MRLKSTLWALAFACAAMSCSDDLENGPGNKNDNEKKGETALINVAISSGPVTKAVAGENGDSFEAGSEDESTVDNVMLILYQNNNTSNGYKVLYDSEIKAIGYTTSVSKPTTGSTIANHTWQTSVEVKVTNDQTTLADNTFGVITVANAGDLTTQIKALHPQTLGSLGDMLMKKVHDSGKKFIMSTHTKGGGDTNLEESIVTLKSNTTESNTPTVKVYVERLAAKIRLGQTGGVTNFTYKVESDQNEELAQVILNSVAVVNQLNSGSYLLKRVTNPSKIYTPDRASGVDLEATVTQEYPDVYLGDETTSNDLASNFVIDPWTRAKRLTDGKFPTNLPTAGTEQLQYLQHFQGSNNAEDETTYNLLYQSFNTTELDPAKFGTNKVTLCYTQENTSSIEGSRQGFSTGAIFKATYYPNKWMAVNDNNLVEAVNVNYGDGETKEAKNFYLYNSIIYKDREAIIASIITNMNDANFTWANIKNGIQYSNDIKNKFLESNLSKENGPFGYVDMIKEKLEAGENVPAFTEWIGNERNHNIDQPNSVLFYKKGECYYRYWIQHASYNSSSQMGVMEFGIVRNNIYDMAVTKITKLGLSGDEKPDPTDPVKSNEFRFNVSLHVKDWTLRDNESIIF